MDNQDAAIAFLSDGASYGEADGKPQRIETHISLVFLVEDRAFKIKRAVRFAYLDFSTLERREYFCRAELALNRRTAPTLYRRVRAITREPDGRLCFDGTGPAVEWVIEMRRFAEAALLDRMADAGSLSAELMRDLADGIAAFHESAEVIDHLGGRAAVNATIAGDHRELVNFCPPLDRASVEALNAKTIASAAALGDLLERRRASGKVRRCHGDLHLRNICLLDGRPTLFDCIEFNENFSCIDVLYDLAFLLMDLLHRGLRDMANLILNRYLDRGDESDGLAALPLFLSMRAAIRAHVLAARNRQAADASALEQARAYLALARAVFETRPPRLIAIGGMSGSGKSSVARLLAPQLLPLPGARIIRSDVIRKRMFDVAPELKLPPAGYDAATTELVYRRMALEAAAVLAAGYPVILDATFLRESEREALPALAARCHASFTGLWLTAPGEILADRLDARRGDASDADRSVLARQLAFDTGAVTWQRIDASTDTTAVLSAVLDRLPPA